MASFSSNSTEDWLQTKAIQTVVASSLKPKLKCSFPDDEGTAKLLS